MKPNNTENLVMTDKEFKGICQLVYDNFGIHLTDAKRSLVVGRLQGYVKSNNFNSYSEYIHFLKHNASSSALSELVSMISTNFTFFFREPEHFDYLRSVVLPEILKSLSSQHSNDVRIWCAAAASGDEPYTLMMTIKEALGVNYQKYSAGLLATDVSDKALNNAIKGVYENARIMHVPDICKKKYLSKIDNDNWKVKDELKKEILFRKLNLLHKYPFKNKFHAIFLRNVMIYFDQKTRDSVVQKMYDVLLPDGYLFIGHAETLGRTSLFEYIKPAVYKKAKN